MYKKILVPLDGSPTSERGFEEAVALARVMKSQPYCGGLGSRHSVTPCRRARAAASRKKATARSSRSSGASAPARRLPGAPNTSGPAPSQPAS